MHRDRPAVEEGWQELLDAPPRGPQQPPTDEYESLDEAAALGLLQYLHRLAERHPRHASAEQLGRSAERIAAHVYAWEVGHKRRRAVMDAAVTIAGQDACEQHANETTPADDG